MTRRRSTSEHVERARELVDADREARLELGDLLHDVAPTPDDSMTGRRVDPSDPVYRFAADAGLSAVEARRLVRVASALSATHREALAATGVSVSYAAIDAAVLRPGGSAELLVQVCRDAASNGRRRVRVDDVDAARRAAVKEQADARRRQRADDRVTRAEREERARGLAFADYRDGIGALVDAQVRDGSPRDAAELRVVRDVSERIANEGGNPADLLSLGSDVIDRHAHVVKSVRKRASSMRAATRRLDTAETTLRRLADTEALASSDDRSAEWLATIDRIVTHALELAERLREGRRGAQ